MIEDPKTSDYICKHLTPEDPMLKELDRVTNLSTLSPRMLSGHVQGNLLTIIAQMLQAKKVLEIGTFTGYSTLCFAKGLGPDGIVYTIDIDEETSSIAQSFFDKSPYASQIKLLLGDAKSIIETIPEVFDLVFIDADKLAYSIYYDLVIDKVRPGGVILLDNILWSGKVYDEKMDKKAKTLHELNERIASDARVLNVILPIRDGLNLVVKQ